MVKKGDLGWLLVTEVAGLVGGTVATKAITYGWKKATGKRPPAKPESPEVALAEALAWSVAVGVGSAVAELLIKRLAAGQWEKGNGRLPSSLTKEI